MKLPVALLLLSGAYAFAPTRSANRVQTQRPFGIDPSSFHDIPHHVESLQQAFPTFTVADALDAVTDVTAGAADAVASVDATASVVDSASKDNGWFGFLTGPIESLLQIIHSVLVGVGMDSNSWGISILAMTVVIKLLTFPLSKQQLESNNKIQALQPEVKAIQAKYQSNPEVMNQKVSELYQKNQVNPLSGCIPSLIQIPVFIGLYRAVLQLSNENKLNEPFLFLPNLEGPTYGADPTTANQWITKGWVDGVPSLGWEDTTAFLILPVFLVVLQFASMQVMQPQTGPDGKAPEQPFVLKLLPLMFGYFALNVPAALCIYWTANTVITTATTLLIKSQMQTEPVAVSSADAATTETSSVFAPPPMREKPAGFSSAFTEDPDMTPITPSDVVDAEVVDEVTTGSGEGMQFSSKGGGKKKKKKKRRN
mmetsp:Transcript_19045/g.28734  ORF Transcript_19045/g.28734 Transcript_19045/m.28734 type:complete len:425 (+) Transcript_19045:175-1449(+)|eukprot:CAMPEP_0178933868 /NCGR_PEP_ID=MMETSP0786-20121207/23538_1 /TAXON_ID=186022 /ORGANISM="Thalassionema frauenfeldii, Strain CCMP 1798" /LENGTH=424 /DNA_ID=CAMNT_0020611571 /DNA_START=89 /DNA_END=1363 /DNA_ORIENTATION=-